MKCSACLENDTDDNPVDDVEVVVDETGVYLWVLLCRNCTEGNI